MGLRPQRPRGLLCGHHPFPALGQAHGGPDEDAGSCLYLSTDLFRTQNACGARARMLPRSVTPGRTVLTPSVSSCALSLALSITIWRVVAAVHVSQGS